MNETLCKACALPEAARHKYPKGCPMKYPEQTCPDYKPLVRGYSVSMSGFIRTLAKDHEANLPAPELARLLVSRAGKP